MQLRKASCFHASLSLPPVEPTQQLIDALALMAPSEISFAFTFAFVMTPLAPLEISFL